MSLKDQNKKNKKIGQQLQQGKSIDFPFQLEQHGSKRKQGETQGNRISQKTSRFQERKSADSLYDADQKGNKTHPEGKLLQPVFFIQSGNKRIGKFQRIEFFLSRHVDEAGDDRKDAQKKVKRSADKQKWIS